MLQESLWMQLATYFSDHGPAFFALGREHIQVGLLALLCSALIGITLGYLTITYKRSEKWIVSLIQILRIVPSLAVLLLLIPLMGTGMKPALIALILLGIPPILMNTISGLNHIPLSILESAQKGRACQIVK